MLHLTLLGIFQYYKITLKSVNPFVAMLTSSDSQGRPPSLRLYVEAMGGQGFEVLVPH